MSLTLEQTYNKIEALKLEDVVLEISKPTLMYVNVPHLRENFNEFFSILKESGAKCEMWIGYGREENSAAQSTIQLSWS